jgi:hypothetical protein
MNSDGHEDIFISQNFFGVANPQQNPRLDSGRGLWMTGDGTGNFKAVPGHQTGVMVYGEQRGAALGDFDGDGRVDLAVSQHSAATKLFYNQSDSKGLSISLVGPVINENGYGSSVRLIYADGSRGPLRTIHAGSGYWSQNSSRQVLGKAGNAIAAEIIWFDGKRESIELDPGQNEVMIRY